MKIYLTNSSVFDTTYCPVVVVVVVTRPLPRDGDVTEDHGAPEAGKLPRAWIRGRKEIESSQRASDPTSA